jgi:hypothetical protein
MAQGVQLIYAEPPSQRTDMVVSASKPTPTIKAVFDRRN